MREYTWTRRTSDEYEAANGGERSRQFTRQINNCEITAIGGTPAEAPHRHVSAGSLSLCLSDYSDFHGANPDAYADAYALHLAGFAACVSAAVMTDLLAAPDPEGLEVAIADLGLSVTHFEG
jgi:hypothetical protein